MRIKTCLRCGIDFQKRNPNQKYCHECSTHNGFKRGYLARIDSIKKSADESGNARVWYAEDGHSQEFLRSLIPG
jgi:hypothetical protein